MIGQPQLQQQTQLEGVGRENGGAGWTGLQADKQILGWNRFGRDREIERYRGETQR